MVGFELDGLITGVKAGGRTFIRIGGVFSVQGGNFQEMVRCLILSLENLPQNCHVLKGVTFVH